ncbi:MAG: hypothetical protein CSB44_06780 [Gammaproteobacteria bacterium]|nr:MAG: hypothetical protein CSB44_06780 [Gammaproteobacteria bacterium]
MHRAAGWQPTASFGALEAAARLRATIRDRMAAEDILEVATPVLSGAAVSDTALASFEVQQGPGGRAAWLQTSPEFPMKRLLAAHGRDIYQFAPVFRGDELGRHHNPEFTLLEWYRVGFDHHDLMRDMAALLELVWQRFDRQWLGVDTVSYQDAVTSLCGDAPDALSVADIVAVFHRHDRHCPPFTEHERDAALDLLVDTFVLPGFATDRFTFLTEYPASQAALARLGISAKGLPCAERFELYYGAIELANGFHELTDAVEQRRRFEADQARREETGMPVNPLDERFLAALDAGLPDCAGVALGIERLLMALLGTETLAEVVSFADECAPPVDAALADGQLTQA